MRTKLWIVGCVLVALLLGSWVMGIADGQQGRMATQERVITYPSKEITYWNHARGPDGVDANDTTPDPNGQTWAAFEDGTYLAFNDRTEHYFLSFYGYGDGTGDGDANGGTFDVNVYLVTRNSSWERINSFNADIGELELTHYPVEGTEINGGSLDPNESYKWAEGKFVAASGGSAIDYDGESNGIGRLYFRSRGAYGLVVLIDNKTSLTKVYPIVRGR